MKVVSTVCARTSSSRLPGKVLLPIVGKPALERLVDRLKLSSNIDEIVIATSTEVSDDSIAELASEMGVNLYRGSLSNVLSRVWNAARVNEADVVVEVTGDMVLLDSTIIDNAVDILVNANCDYVSNVIFNPKLDRLVRTYPMGVNAVVFKFSALTLMHENAKTEAQREHVTYYADQHPEEIHRYFMQAPINLARPSWRFALDYPEDYQFISKIFEELLPSNPTFSYVDVMELLDREPKLLDINMKASCI